jgi:hypothetical protein
MTSSINNSGYRSFRGGGGGPAVGGGMAVPRHWCHGGAGGWSRTRGGKRLGGSRSMGRTEEEDATRKHEFDNARVICWPSRIREVLSVI